MNLTAEPDFGTPASPFDLATERFRRSAWIEHEA